MVTVPAPTASCVRGTWEAGLTDVRTGVGGQGRSKGPLFVSGLTPRMKEAPMGTGKPLRSEPGLKPGHALLARLGGHHRLSQPRSLVCGVRGSL